MKESTTMSLGKLSQLFAAVTNRFNGSSGGVSGEKLSQLLGTAARKFNVPGIAVGVFSDGKVTYSSYGVTDINNPTPVDENTLFVIASVTKTFTATAIMRLVANEKIDLDAPVKRYIPEFKLQDQAAAEQITVLNLLNHTSGLEWRLDADTGEGDDALAAFVAKMVDLKQIAPAGTRASYSQAGYDLLGRVVEKVAGKTYEQAVASLLLEPLGLTNSFFALDDIMARRFAIGHNADEKGKLSVAQTLKYSRAENPGGGLASSATDLIHWARFHLGDSSVNGEGVLPTQMRKDMQKPTVELTGSSLGDAIGIGWFLRDINGVKTVGHSGSGNGQFAELLMVPERNFAVVALCNAGPNGIQFNQAVLQWTLQKYVGLVERALKPLPYDSRRAQEIIGRYENEIQIVTIASTGKKMTIAAGIKPEVRASSEKELPADYPPANMGLLPGDKDEYIVTAGGMKGQRGFFNRDENGTIKGLDIGGRTFAKIDSQ
jgi:CubicO group peptidase (beta-lactamase class C family)